MGFIFPPSFMKGMKRAEQFQLWDDLCLKYPQLKRFGRVYYGVGLFGYIVFFFATIGPAVDRFGPLLAGLVLAPLYILLDEVAKHLLVAPQIKKCMAAAAARDAS